MALVALKYQAKRTVNGIEYPFDRLPCVAKSKIASDGRMPRWEAYLKMQGGFLAYDQASTIDVDSPDLGSPSGCWDMIILAPPEFAKQASSVDGVTTFKQSEARKFWEERVTVNQHAEEYDSSVLSAIASKKALNIELSASDKAALDPNKSSPGIRKSKNKKWEDFKKSRGIKVVDLED